MPLAGLFLQASGVHTREHRLGGPAPLTLANYAELLDALLRGFLSDTMRINLRASFAGVLLAFPLAYWITRRLSPRWREIVIGSFVTLMFLSVLVRTYALELTLGAAGPLRSVLLGLGISPNSRGYIELLVAGGLLHYIVPMELSHFWQRSRMSIPGSSTPPRRSVRPAGKLI